VYEETDFDNNYKELKENSKKRNWQKWLFLLLFLLLLFLLLFLLIYFSFIYKLFNDITTGRISPIDEAKNIVWAGELDGEKSGDINVLLLGMRGEDEELEPYATNAIMIANIDLKTKNVHLISIPRDTLISVEGYGYSKANLIYKIAKMRFGDNEDQNLKLSKKTYGDYLGIDINYAFLLDFSGFENMIDDIGKIKIELTEEELNNYPFLQEKEFENAKLENLDTTFQLNGKQSLMFIRWPKNAIPDFDRIKRQHLFLYSLRDQYLNYNVLLNPIKVIRMMQAGVKNIKTDFHLWEFLKFLEEIENIKIENINKHYLNTSENTEGGLLSESSNQNNVIYVPKNGINELTAIHDWAKTIVNQ